MVMTGDPVEQVAQMVRRRYQPAGAVHEPELQAKYLGVSTIVKGTATDYAERILAQKRGEPLPERGSRFWSFRGDNLGREAFADAQAWEVQASVPLGLDGWILRGHVDAVYVVDEAVVVGEHKVHNDVTDEDVEQAFRQGALCLALLEAEAMRLVPPHDFKQAPWAPALAPFTWHPEFHAEGVVVGAVRAEGDAGGRHEPTRAIPRPLSAAERLQVLEFYTDKARAIVTAVLKDDVHIATAWDLEHGGEFVRSFQHIMDPPEDLASLLARFRALKDLEDQTKEQRYAEGRAIKEALDALVRRGEVVADEKGRLRGIVAGDHVLNWVKKKGARRASVKALEEAGLTQFISEDEPSEFPEVKRMVEVEDE